MEGTERRDDLASFSTKLTQGCAALSTDPEDWSTQYQLDGLQKLTRQLQEFVSIQTDNELGLSTQALAAFYACTEEQLKQMRTGARDALSVAQEALAYRLSQREQRKDSLRRTSSIVDSQEMISILLEGGKWPDGTVQAGALVGDWSG